jgi:hypothetical protein
MNIIRYDDNTRVEWNWDNVREFVANNIWYIYQRHSESRSPFLGDQTWGGVYVKQS